MIHCLSCNRKNSPKLAISKPTTLLALSFLLGTFEGYLKDAQFIVYVKALLKGEYVSTFEGTLEYTVVLNFIPLFSKTISSTTFV